MAKIDRAKEFIGFLKAIFLALIAIDASLISWLFNHPSLNVNSSLVIIGIAVSSIVIIVLFKYVLKKIQELEDL